MNDKDSIIQLIKIVKRNNPLANQLYIEESGWDHIIIIADKKQVYRFPRNETAKKDFVRENTFLKHFAPMSNLPVPEAELITDKQTGELFSTYEYMPGLSLTSSLYRSISEKYQSLIAKELGKFLQTLHSFPIDVAKKYGVKDYSRQHEFKKYANDSKKLLFKYLTQVEQLMVKNFFEKALKIFTNSNIELRTTHADFAPEHILINPKTNKLVGIIDFGDITISDPAYDFQLEQHYGKSFMKNLFINYNLQLDEGFEKRIKIYEKSLPIRNALRSVKSDSETDIRFHIVKVKDHIRSNLSF